MTKPVSIKFPDETYDEMMSYAQAQGKSLTGFCRGIIKHGFFHALQQDKATLDRYQRMLEDPAKYELTNRDIVDMETHVAILKATTERFSEFWAYLASELYGEEAGEDSDNA
jgi:hypothetical protein